MVWHVAQGEEHCEATELLLPLSKYPLRGMQLVPFKNLKFVVASHVAQAVALVQVVQS